MMRPLVSSFLWIILLVSPVHAQLVVDNSDRADVTSFYETVYGASVGVPHEWNGNTSICDPGTTSQAYRDATVLRINYYRTLVGLSPISELASKTSSSQQMALLMAANDYFGHSPQPSHLCYTADAATAGQNSMVVLGSPTAALGVDVLVMDDGLAPSFRLGHRRWVLYPRYLTVGVGTAVNSSSLPYHAIWVIGAEAVQPPDPPPVTWPSAGYFPVQHMPEWWSLALPSASFDQATVTVTREGAPEPIVVEVLPLFYGDNGIAWRPDVRPSAPLNAEIHYTVQVNGVLDGGESRDFSYDVIVFDVEDVTHVGEEDLPSLSSTLTLSNHPNPFNPRTSISYSIPEACQVELEIYDLAGRHVKTLISEHMGAGEHQVRWDGKDAGGVQVGSGVYLYRLRAGEQVETRRMALLK